MLTSDENVVRVEMNVQYRVTDPERYLFSVTSADDSLRQATDSGAARRDRQIHHGSHSDRRSYRDP
ncbi:cell division protein FtsH [Klebsiella aerogenes]|nr:cell division protein FtsH [Klebsiella aerogenes]